MFIMDKPDSFVMESTLVMCKKYFVMYSSSDITFISFKLFFNKIKINPT